MSKDALVYDADETAEVCRVCRRTVFNLTKAGVLPAVRIGSRVVYLKTTVEKFLASRETVATAGAE